MQDQLAAELIAVIVAVTGGEPRVLTIDGGTALPSGSFESGQRSLQAGLRSWVERQTHQRLGYVEQLYTFADSDRAEAAGGRVISISYLALAREARVLGTGASWQSWYRYFPWEDHRIGTPPCLADAILPALAGWATTDSARQRIAITFGTDGKPWNEDLSLQRYELLHEAGLVPEWLRGHPGIKDSGLPGDAMILDHRRILATGIARLRAKIKYRPVFFELMPESFTLLQLQQTVEALAGRRLHKQNFRRLIDQQNLVEETGLVAQDTGGRPAQLFRYRRDVQAERAIAATRLPLARS
ncbi:MAG TPA: hypothetical protein VMB71_13380 [Acetobacteraceae bacterium]|nr:hypothetical protein [Acetobacteraceae bacterium]